MFAAHAMEIFDKQVTLSAPLRNCSFCSYFVLVYWSLFYTNVEKIKKTYGAYRMEQRLAKRVGF